MSNHPNQIASIEVLNPKDTDGESKDAYGQCNCCGEDAQTHGMCRSCAMADCSPKFSVACNRTGAVDPLGLWVPDSVADLLDL
jgi:hypothetical protein